MKELRDHMQQINDLCKTTRYKDFRHQKNRCNPEQNNSWL